MKRMNRMAAMCLALAGSISATVTLAGTNVTATSVPPSSAKLSQLAAELADTSARLAELQEAYSLVEKFTEEVSAKDETRTTVRWLSSNSKQLSRNARIDIEITPAIATDVVEARAIAPRPAAIAYRQGSTALAAPTTSTIIHAQANEEVFHTAQADQNLVQSAQGELSPQLDRMPWGDPVFCSDGCCDTCCSPRYCRPKRRPRRILVMGTEAVFLDADINGQQIRYRFDDFDPGAPAAALFGPDYGDAAIDDFYIAPRLWLGVQGECWGVVGRYFHLRIGEHDHDPYVPPGLPGEHSFDANSIFEAYYTDLEVTRNFCLHGCKSQLSFGARYALIEHNENIYGRSVVSDGLLTAYGRSNRQAHGTGITFGLNGRKPLFCNSCAHLFYNVRSSILWGYTHNEVETDAAVVASGGATAIAGTIDGAIVRVADDLFIGEVQLGIEWDFALRCLPAKSFFRAAFEYQYWDASSGYAAAGSFAGFGDPSSPDSLVAVNAEAPGLIVDLIGFSVGTGFTW